MFNIARKPIRMLFTDVCTIKNTVITTNNYGISESTLNTICVNEPCRISYSTVTANDESDGIGRTAQNIKLFIREDLTIPSGSVIEVTRNDRTTTYKSSGFSAIYDNHQEINLILDQKYA